tara:strand:+ start:196 stop:756 length:561 start_codon:yes stop_codon:yes gene_type:complete
MIHPWHDVTPSVPGLSLPEHVSAVIEIPKGSSNKYELDKQTGMLRLDRVLSSAVYYPANYGFIPQTMAEDDDPLDILVFCAETIPPLCVCDVRVVGMMTMIDDGDPDHKIIGVIHNGPEFSHYKAASEFPPHTFKMLRRFFEDYKTLEDKVVEVDEILPPDRAHEVIEDSMRRYSAMRQRGELKGA